MDDIDSEEQTCGRGLAQSAAVPGALAAVAAGLAQNLEVHLQTLADGDAATVHELDIYLRVARNLRNAVAELDAAAAQMDASADLPVGAHNMAAASAADLLGAFESVTAAEDQLRRLLEERQNDNEEMLAAIRAEAGRPDS